MAEEARAQMATKIEQRQTKLIQSFLKAADMSSTKQLPDLIHDATSNHGLICYAEIVSAPIMLKLVGTKNDSVLDLLRLFAFGTWRDYKCNTGSYPALTPKQVDKLKQLHLITLLHSNEEISYGELMKELDLHDLDALKRFLQFCLNSGNVKFRNIGGKKKIVVEYVPKIRASVACGKSFDLFLQEAAAVVKGKDGMLRNGIVKLVKVPLDKPNSFTYKSEFLEEASCLFSMLIQQMVHVHACKKSFGGKIYPGMFFKIGNRLFLRSEAAPTKALTGDNSKLDYSAVKIIFVNHTALHVRIDGKEELIYPMYSDDLFYHLDCNEGRVATDHINNPMVKALDANYTTFLVCHPIFQTPPARSSTLVYVRKHHKYAITSDKESFQKAMELKRTAVDWERQILPCWLFHGAFSYALLNGFFYPDSDMGYFLLLRDWETHVPEHLTEQQKLIYTSEVRNYLIGHYFNDFVPHAQYKILCFYRDKHGAFRFREWLQNLLQLPTIETISTTMASQPLSLCGQIMTKTSFQHISDQFSSAMKMLDGSASGNCQWAKWRILNNLRDENIALYYRVLIDKIEEYGPIIYMTTIDVVLKNPSPMFQRPGVLYINKEDKGNMMPMIQNWSTDQVDMIVLTDGSGLSGIKDIGAEGASLVIAKKDLYVASCGINPQRILPVVMDVGTDSQKLLEDPLYYGLKERRLRGDEYHEIIKEFIDVASMRWSNAIVQFEYIENNLGLQLLERYKNSHCVFNDNIQGAAFVTIAGMLGAVRAQGKRISDFAKQKIIVAAGDSFEPCLEMVNAAAGTMRTSAGNIGTTFDSVRKMFWIVDAKGLLTENRPNIGQDAYRIGRKKHELICEGLGEGASFVEVVRKVKPDIVLLLSSVVGLSSGQVFQVIENSSFIRPAIFALSAAQYTAEEAFSTFGGNVIFASSNQFPNVNLGNGQSGFSNHITAIYLFPGITLGAHLSGAVRISNEMISAATSCLVSMVDNNDVLNGILYPPISRIRHITKEVARSVLSEAIAKNLAKGNCGLDAAKLAALSKEQIIRYVEDNVWSPCSYM